MEPENLEYERVPEYAENQMSSFIVNNPAVEEFVCRENGLINGNIQYSIGLERDGEVVAGIVYCDKTPTNVFLHVAAKPGVNWVSRAFLKLVFGFPFDGLKVKRITALVPESNTRAVRFDRHLGFKDEARLDDIFPEGALLVMKMTRADCRYV